MNPPSPMTHPKQVFRLLQSHKNERGIQHWNRLYPTRQGGLKSYGIGLTVLRKLAKTIGRNHELALQLWDSDIYDAKVIALLIDDPKKLVLNKSKSKSMKWTMAIWFMCFQLVMRRSQKRLLPLILLLIG